MLIGLLSVTFTFLFFRYFASILYGCLAPVCSSNVIIKVAAAISEASSLGVGWSVAAPMAGTVYSRPRAGLLVAGDNAFSMFKLDAGIESSISRFRTSPGSSISFRAVEEDESGSGMPCVFGGELRLVISTAFEGA